MKTKTKTLDLKTKTFLVFLCQNLRSLIQCQHKQQHQQERRQLGSLIGCMRFLRFLRTFVALAGNPAYGRNYGLCTLHEQSATMRHPLTLALEIIFCTHADNERSNENEIAGLCKTQATNGIRNAMSA